MRSSESIENLAGALVRAQGGLRNPRKDAKADAVKFSYAYASLPSILDEVRPVLELNDLAVLQETVTTEGGIGVTTRIQHKSGEWIEMGPLLMVRSNSPQENGSALTYARRYALSAALNLAADEDDDGAKASRKTSLPSEGKRGEAPPTHASSAPGAGMGSGGVPAPNQSATVSDGTVAAAASSDAASGGDDGNDFGEGSEAVVSPAPQHDLNQRATDEQWNRLLALPKINGSMVKAVNRINRCNQTNYTRVTAQEGATFAELLLAISNEEAA